MSSKLGKLVALGAVLGAALIAAPMPGRADPSDSAEPGRMTAEALDRFDAAKRTVPLSDS